MAWLSTVSNTQLYSCRGRSRAVSSYRTSSGPRSPIRIESMESCLALTVRANRAGERRDLEVSELK
jgi:hypothetical protein